MEAPPPRRCGTGTVTADEGPRPDTSLESLAKLRADLPCGGHGHRGQRVDAQRRRGMRWSWLTERAEQLDAEPLARIVATGGRGRRSRR